MQFNQVSVMTVSYTHLDVYKRQEYILHWNLCIFINQIFNTNYLFLHKLCHINYEFQDNYPFGSVETYICKYALYIQKRCIFSKGIAINAYYTLQFYYITLSAYINILQEVNSVIFLLSLTICFETQIHAQSRKFGSGDALINDAFPDFHGLPHPAFFLRVFPLRPYHTLYINVWYVLMRSQGSFWFWIMQ